MFGGVCACGRRTIARGMCSACYAQWRRTDPTRPRCEAPGCDQYGSITGLCAKHYARMLQYGTTELPPSDHAERVRIDIYVSPDVIEAAREVLASNESLSSFAASALTHEVERRRGGSMGGYGDVKVCECGRRAVTRGLCQACYAHWRRTGDTIRTHRSAPAAGVPKKITVSIPPYLGEAVRGVLAPGETLTSFGASAIANEIAQRRTLERR